MAATALLILAAAAAAADLHAPCNDRAPTPSPPAADVRFIRHDRTPTPSPPAPATDALDADDDHPILPDEAAYGDSDLESEWQSHRSLLARDPAWWRRLQAPCNTQNVTDGWWSGSTPATPGSNLMGW
jgi:hypothetical protein